MVDRGKPDEFRNPHGSVPARRLERAQVLPAAPRPEPRRRPHANTPASQR